MVSLARQYQRALQEQDKADFDRLRIDSMVNEDRGNIHIKFRDGSIYESIKVFSDFAGYRFETSITD